MNAGPEPKKCECDGEIDKTKAAYQLKIVFSFGKFVLYKKSGMKFQCKKCGGYKWPNTTR